MADTLHEIDRPDLGWASFAERLNARKGPREDHRSGVVGIVLRQSGNGTPPVEAGSNWSFAKRTASDGHAGNEKILTCDYRLILGLFGRALSESTGSDTLCYSIPPITSCAMSI